MSALAQPSRQISVRQPDVTLASMTVAESPRPGRSAGMSISSRTIEQLARDTVRIADPEVALRALTALRQELDATEPELVQRALQAGASWSRIARAIGITKQAAHRKYRYVLDH